MKDTLYAVVSLVLKTAVFFLCITLVVIFSPVLRFPLKTPSTAYILYQISSWGAEAFFAALFMALVSTHFRIIRKPGKKILSFILILAAAFCVLYSGLFGLGVFFPEPDTEEAWADIGMPLEKNSVRRVGDVFVWITENKEGVLGPVVVMDKGKGAGNFHVYAEGVFDAKSRTLKLVERAYQPPLPGSTALESDSPGGAEISLEGPGFAYTSPFLRFFVDDLIYITDMLRPRALLDIPALYSTFALVFFIFSLWTLAKLSRWPLFNLWFTLAASWIVFSGTRILGIYLVPELGHFETLAWAAQYIPVAFPAVCGFLLFLAGLFGKPINEWKREMRYD
ncbi:MAG: hypothetical protein LBT68_02160 [Spirochaetales bacterium]|nr:hypothetical protein [Spirochaetales bacterium]